MIEELLQSRTVVCVGSGGVGKTTISAALAVMAARRGLRALVMTIDPSLRLKVALGIEGEGGETVSVPGQKYPGHLSALLLNSEKIFQDFVRQAAEDPAAAERLAKNRLYQQLSTTLSGSQEFTALLQLTRMLRDENFDLVILDTPPAQHAIDFLEAPEKLYALFQESIVRWFIAETANANLLRRLISKGTRTVLGALEKVTGSQFMLELEDFFQSVKSVQAQIAAKTMEVRELLRAPTTRFVLVTGFDEAKLREAAKLKSYLYARDFHLQGIVINRSEPPWGAAAVTPPADAVFDPIRELCRRLTSYESQRREIFERFAQEWGMTLPVLRIPDFNKEIVGLTGLEVLANEIENRAH